MNDATEKLSWGWQWGPLKVRADALELLLNTMKIDDTPQMTEILLLFDPVKERTPVDRDIRWTRLHVTMLLRVPHLTEMKIVY